ncbi:hypothetical protein BU16DRAFT_611846 [Lophium mytilinum]|uniref:Sm domain-containing protein n=1 Tax=Lophium mytilinum TaxID=390894 RepID=A0A6A6RCF5_9PEZI|nr:hypothetical protein BU16DRAFT_611846 [Lophium mytilinum]
MTKLIAQDDTLLRILMRVGGRLVAAILVGGEVLADIICPLRAASLPLLNTTLSPPPQHTLFINFIIASVFCPLKSSCTMAPPRPPFPSLAAHDDRGHLHRPIHIPPTLADHHSPNHPFKPEVCTHRTVSARSIASLKTSIVSLIGYLHENPDTTLPSLSYTTTARRMQHHYRPDRTTASSETIRASGRTALGDLLSPSQEASHIKGPSGTLLPQDESEQKSLLCRLLHRCLLLVGVFSATIKAVSTYTTSRPAISSSLRSSSRSATAQASHIKGPSVALLPQDESERTTLLCHLLDGSLLLVGALSATIKAIFRLADIQPYNGIIVSIHPPSSLLQQLRLPGRTLVGILISCDHNTNIVLQDTIERIIVPAYRGTKEKWQAGQPSGPCRAEVSDALANDNAASFQPASQDRPPPSTVLRSILSIATTMSTLTLPL